MGRHAPPRRVVAASVAALLAVLGVVAAVGRAAEPLPGMPPVVDPTNLYSETQAGRISPAVAGALPRVYVPNPAGQYVYRICPAPPHGVGRFYARLNIPPL